MATMKIGTTAQAYAAADYSFQVNPKSVNVPMENNYNLFPIPFGKLHVFYGADGVATRRIILTGTTYGTSKLTHWRNLTKQIHANSVKRFWIDNDRFYNVLGRSATQVFQGGRTNFIDYVAAVDCVTPYALAAAASTYTVTLTDATKTTLNDATANSTGAFTNAGDAPAFVDWQINNNAGSAITKIEIGDSSDYDTSTHKLTWNGSLTSGNTLNIDVFNYVSEGTRGTYKAMELGYPRVGTTKTGNAEWDGENPPWVNAGATDQAFSIKLTGNDDTATITATYRASYTG